jgi:hypothetical protein
MLRINLNNGYFVEVGKLDYTLKQEYVSKSGKTATRIVGYYSNMRHLMRKYLEQCQISYKAPDGIEMMEYVKMVEESNERAVSGLYDVLDRFPIK